MNDIIRNILAFILFTFFQVFLLDELELFNIAPPFPFLLFIFMLPTSIPTPLLYIITFATGLIVDILSGSPGLHAFSCVFAIALRGQVILATMSSHYRSATEISLNSQASSWYVTYLLTLIIAHHTVYYLLEAMVQYNFLYTVMKIIVGSLYTFVLSYMLALLFYKK